MQQIQRDIYQQMTPEQKIEAFLRLYASAKQLMEAGMRERHPDWSQDKVERFIKQKLMYART